MDSPLQHSKSRDVHGVGVLFLQMLVGWNVMEVYPNPKLALQSCPFLHLFGSHTPMTDTLNNSLLVQASGPSHHQHAQPKQEEWARMSIRVTGYGDECSIAAPRIQDECDHHSARYGAVPWALYIA